MESPTECPICRGIFKEPVVLTCEHNFCKECLQSFWRHKDTQYCPTCRRKNSQEHPPVNLALETLCDFLKEGNERSGSEKICSLHGEKLQLFCLEDKQPVCEMCIKSKKHIDHTLEPISEAVSSQKEQLSTTVKSLEATLEQTENIKEHIEKTAQHITVEVEHAEHQIKHKFEKLHQLIKDEEAATITALKEEEEQKKQKMKENLEEMKRNISALSDAIKESEELLKADDDRFLKEYSASMERVQISQPDPEMPSGASINVLKYTGNLLSRVWKNLEEKIKYTDQSIDKSFDQYVPVFLDPSTAHKDLVVSEDLLSVRRKENKTDDKPEKPYYPFVLGSEGFNSGKHIWDVEVKDSEFWSVGVTKASDQLKGEELFNSDLICVWYDKFCMAKWPGFCVKDKPERVRVELDYEKGTVSFSDPVTKTHLHTFTTTFTDTIFPFFHTLYPLKILPSTTEIGTLV